MSKPTATRARPLSPHLQIYRFTPTMAVSILQRITGGGLYFGVLLFALWLLAAAASPEWFDFVNMLFGSILGRLVIFGYTWALIHHMLGGIRYLIWDTTHAMEKKTATAMAVANMVGSIVLTLVIWGAAWIIRGGL